MDDSPFSPTTLYTISLRKDKVQRTIWHNTWLLVRCTFVSNLGLSQCVSCLGGPRKARHLSRANWYCWPISACRKCCLLFLALEWNFPTNDTLTLPACSHCRLRLIQKCISFTDGGILSYVVSCMAPFVFVVDTWNAQRMRFLFSPSGWSLDVMFLPSFLPINRGWPALGWWRKLSNWRRRWRTYVTNI